MATDTHAPAVVTAGGRPSAGFGAAIPHKPQPSPNSNSNITWRERHPIVARMVSPFGGVVAAAVLVCILPGICELAGVTFHSPTLNDEATRDQFCDAAAEGGGGELALLFTLTRGAFVHSLLEWSAFVVACTTFAVSLLHLQVHANSIAPYFGVGLITAGTMDCVHTLVAARLVATKGDINYVPFTWALSRTVSAVSLSASLFAVTYIR